MPDKIMWPDGGPDVKAPAFAAVQAVTIENRKTLLKLALTGNCTLNLTVDPEIARSGSAGAELQIEVSSDGTARSLTFGTAMLAPVIAGAINKTFTQAFELGSDGIFRPQGAAVQIN